MKKGMLPTIGKCTPSDGPRVCRSWFVCLIVPLSIETVEGFRRQGSIQHIAICLIQNQEVCTDPTVPQVGLPLPLRQSVLR